MSKPKPKRVTQYIPEDRRGSIRVRVPRELAEDLGRQWGIDPSDAVVRAVKEAATRQSSEEP